MENQLFFIFFLDFLLFNSAQPVPRTLTIKNLCNEDVMFGYNMDSVSNETRMTPKQKLIMDVWGQSGGRLWYQTGCTWNSSTGKLIQCQTATSGQATLWEWTLSAFYGH